VPEKPLVVESRMPIGHYVVPVEVLNRDPRLTIEVLRLGALANALNAVAGMSATAASTGVGGRAVAHGHRASREIATRFKARFSSPRI
jgi:hypothetical protein